jgi:hypothetical protein
MYAFETSVTHCRYESKPAAAQVPHCQVVPVASKGSCSNDTNTQHHNTQSVRESTAMWPVTHSLTHRVVAEVCVLDASLVAREATLVRRGHQGTCVGALCE